MAVEILILMLATVIWQAQSQSRGQQFSVPGDCSVSQNLCAASSSLQCATPFFEDNCINLNFATLGLKGCIIPIPPATSARSHKNNKNDNLCSEAELPELIAGASRCRPISNIAGPQIKLSAYSGSVSEANSSLGLIYPTAPKLPNPICGINRVTPYSSGGQNNLANSVLSDSLINIKSRRPVLNAGRNNVTPNVQTTATETTTTGATTSPFGGVYNQGTSTTITSNAEGSSSVNIRPDSFTPCVFRGLNIQPGSVSSVGTSDATNSVRFPGIYSSNIFGCDITPTQTSAATTKSSLVATSSVGPSRVLTPIQNAGFYYLRPASATATEASSVTTSNAIGSNIYDSTVNTAQSSANAESSSFTNIKPPSIWTLKYFGAINNVGQTSVSTSSSSEANAFTNSGPPNMFTSRFPGPLLPVIHKSSNAEADSSASIGLPNPYLSNITPVSTTVCPEATSINPSRVFSQNYITGYKNIAQPTVSSVASSESSSAVNIIPSSMITSFYGDIKQTAYLPERKIGSACLELPLFYPNTCCGTEIFNSIPPQSCRYETVDKIDPSCSIPFDYPSVSLPIFAGFSPVYPLGQAVAIAAASTVKDINNPFTPCDDKVISSSSTSSSSFSIVKLPPVTLEVQIPSSFASSLSSNFYGCSSCLPSIISSCMPESIPPVVYELQIPSSIPAQILCSLKSVPSSVPALCMNVEPIEVCCC